MSSDPLLHIKDSYYFDVPRKFWRAGYESPQQLADQVGGWVIRNDADYQDWEADRFLAELSEIVGDDDALSHAKEAWHHWQHADKRRHGRPFDQYVEDSVKELQVQAAAWAKKEGGEADGEARDPALAYLAAKPDAQLQWMHSLKLNDRSQKKWENVRRDMNSESVLTEYLESPRAEWSETKLQEYNFHLSGKVFIPQPFGELKNAYEVDKGFGISRYMVIEVVVAILILLTFRWLAGKIQDGSAPRGRLWNLLESFLTFIKTDVVEKGIDPHDSPKFMPLFWTIFMFILGCNLMGMLPWVGSPTASWGLTAVLALAIFAVSTYEGIKAFGIVGFLKNLCPDLGLPIYLGIVIVPMVWLIEFASLFIKHTILSVRLLLNMAAGHLVLLGIMGLAFGAHAAAMHPGSWTALSVVALLGTTILSFLELFVAFLQAYVFTLLAALFVGSASHHH